VTDDGKIQFSIPKAKMKRIKEESGITWVKMISNSYPYKHVE